MQRVVRSIARWSIPPGVCDIARFLYMKAHSWRDREVIARSRENTRFRNAEKGSRCFILGTGPSIASQDLRPLAGEVCIAVSMFFVHEHYREIAPRYHVLAPNHAPFGNEVPQKYLENYERLNDSRPMLFLGHRPYEYSFYEFLKEHPKFNNESIFFINYAESEELDEGNSMCSRVWDISRRPFQIRTVLYSAIQIAVYLGCSPIYLLGADHDYLNDLSRVRDHHFYSDDQGIDDSAHLASFSTEMWLEEYYRRWKQYRLMRDYIAMQGGQVLNATDGGLLDVFPRVKLSEILNNRQVEDES